MARGFEGDVLRQFRTLFGVGAVGDLTDGELLSRFLEKRGEPAEAAFGALVQRHGPMVLGVCGRVLRDSQETEDAFQATFLVLARKARSIRSRESLGAWLFGVARRISLRAKVQAVRRRAEERRLAGSTSTSYEVDPGRSQAIDRLLLEVERLPDRLREPVVLFYFEGLTYEGAASSLRITEGTIRGRLARARDLLRHRLEPRGVSVGLLVPAILSPPGPASIPFGVLESTIRASSKLASGEAASKVVSSSVVTLMEGALKPMLTAKLKATAALAVVIGLAGFGAAVSARQQPTAKPRPKQLALGQTAAEVPKAADKAGEIETLSKLVDGRVVRSVEVTKDCMVLSYMPGWGFGNVDNIGVGGVDGGNRTLVNWPDVPAADAKSHEFKFYLAFYSRDTTSAPKPGQLLAFDLSKEWEERTCWKTCPDYEPEPVGTYKFEPGNGWKVFDITTRVRASDGKSGKGLIFRFLIEDRSKQGEWSGYKFVSREGQGEWANRRPMLLVVEPSKK